MATVRIEAYEPATLSYTSGTTLYHKDICTQIKSLAHCTHYQMTSFLWKACNILSTFKASDEHQKVNRVEAQCYAA